MSEVSSENVILVKSVPKKTDGVILWSALKDMRISIAYL